MSTTSRWLFEVNGVSPITILPGWTINMTANGRNRFVGRFLSADGSFRPGIDQTIRVFEQVDIQSIATGNPTVITTKEAHGLVTGRFVGIGSVVGNTPNINGFPRCIVITPTTFSIPFNTTIAGSGGFSERSVFFGTNITPREHGPAGVVGRKTATIETEVTAVSFDAFTERRYVKETLLAGTMLSMLTTLVANYLPGVTIDANQVTGPSLPAIPCDYVLLRDVLDTIAQLSVGYVWEIDAYEQLRMFLPSGEAAPFDIVDGDRHALGDIVTEPTRTSYANRIILRFTSAALSAYAFYSVSTNFANGETIVIGSKTYTFETSLTNVDGHVQIGVDANTSLGNFVAAVNLAGGAGSSYAAATTANSQVSAFQLSTASLKVTALTTGASGNSIGISTTAVHGTWFGEGNVSLSALQNGADAALTSRAISEDTGEQAAHGIWELIVEASNITDYTLALAAAAQELAIHKLLPKKVTYSTLGRGLYPGQKQTINIASRHVNNTFLITDVNGGSWQGNVIRWTVTAVESLVIGAVTPWQDLYKQWSGQLTGGGGTLAIAIGTTGGSGGGGAGGGSGSGTIGKLAKWLTTTSLTDSIVSESSLQVTVGAGTGSPVVSINAGGANVPGYGFQNAGTFKGEIAYNTSVDTMAFFVGGIAGGNLQLTLSSTQATFAGAIGWVGNTFGTGLVRAANGGTGVDTSGWSGVPTINSGAWTQNNVLTANRLLIAGASNTVTSSANLAFSGTTLTVNNTINTTSSADLVLAPTGGLITAPVANAVLPPSSYLVNVGAFTNKYLSIFASELRVESLIAQQTITTIGGRALIASGANILAAAVSTGTTSFSFKYNDLTNGDVVLFEGPDTGGTYSTEFMQVASAASGGGPYTYTMTRNYGGSTAAHNWPAGAACMNTGQTGAGFIDLYALNSLKSSIEAGPTIVGNVRNSNTYNDWSPRWAIGNLKNITAYGYGSTTFAVALGDGTKAWMSLDDTNGLRIMYGGAVHAQIDTSGNAMFASGNCTIDQNGVRIATTTGYTSDRGYTFTTGFSGTNLAGTYAFETGANTRVVAIQNTTTAASKFVAATLHAGGSSTGSTLSAVNDELSAGGPYVEVNCNLRPTVDNTISCGTAALRWSTVYAGNGTINTSDVREKRDITDCSFGVRFLMALRPVDYFWRNPSVGTRCRHGFIAQEIDLDFGGLDINDSAPWGLDYAQLIAPLVVGFQDHETRLRKLEGIAA